MFVIGLIREGKIPADNRVALTPAQCEWLQSSHEIKIVVQPCVNRCFSSEQYVKSGIEVKENLGECDLLLGIKEVPVADLIPGKKYMFFLIQKKNNHKIKNYCRKLSLKK